MTDAFFGSSNGNSRVAEYNGKRQYKIAVMPPSMIMDKIIVAIASVLGAGLTYWFFLGKKDKEVRVSDSVDIVVNGGYTPEAIAIPKGKTTKLNFIRKDPTACLEEVVLGDFKIRRQLPLNQKVTIELTPRQAGSFTYSCGMGMYHGKIIVTE